MSRAPAREPVWLTLPQILALHAESLRLFGGAAGVRDRGLLEGALARPQQCWACDPSATLFELAAALGYGVARTRAFGDGNKRAALLATQTFLFRNGFAFSPDRIETVTTIEQTPRMLSHHLKRASTCLAERRLLLLERRPTNSLKAAL